MKKLWAISDLHIPNQKNRDYIAQIKSYPEDWLILAGDICERAEDLDWLFSFLKDKFEKLIWVPGNHELWSVADDAKMGEEKYQEMVAVCRKHHVSCPEDPYLNLQIYGSDYTIAPLFLLYDYSFHPPAVKIGEELRWAEESGIVCSDEYYLRFNPYQSRRDWCHQRVHQTYDRLKKIPRESNLILVNHFQLRYDLVTLPRIPRFSIWCGTQLTENWHREFNVKVVISGHLHLRSTFWRDQVRFEEVSLGNPKQYNPEKPIDDYLREILPADQITEQNSGFGPW